MHKTISVRGAREHNLKGGDYKKLNLPFENRLMGMPKEIRQRMVKGVEDFVYDLLTNVFNASDTADLAIKAILDAGSYALGPKAESMEDAKEWTAAKIKEKASQITSDKGAKGNFDD